MATLLGSSLSNHTIKQYHVVNNVLSEQTLKLLEKYHHIADTDVSSHDLWSDELTDGGKDVANYSVQLSGKDKVTIIADIAENTDLPCAGKKWIRDADIAIQKLPPGGIVRSHFDHCKFSLTVFLQQCDGGEFCWTDENNVEHTVKPTVNTGIYAYYDEYQYGACHRVKPVTGDKVRVTMQLFVFDKQHNKGVKVGETLE